MVFWVDYNNLKKSVWTTHWIRDQDRIQEIHLGQAEVEEEEEIVPSKKLKKILNIKVIKIIHRDRITEEIIRVPHHLIDSRAHPLTLLNSKFILKRMRLCRKLSSIRLQLFLEIQVVVNQPKSQNLFISMQKLIIRGSKFCALSLGESLVKVLQRG